MALNYSVLDKDVQITDATVPVISPYWRLKRSGDWILMWKYDPEQTYYSVISPLMGATLPLLNGNLTFRHLAMVLQYAHDFETLEKARDFLISAVKEVNKEDDVVVQMEENLAPYVKKYDPLEFIIAPSENSIQERLAYPLSLNLMFSNACQTKCVYCYANGRQVPPSQHLSTERWIEIFREASSLGIEQVSLSGGDPLFRKDSLTLIAELIRLEMLFLLSTKCHVTREMADRLVDIGMNQPINQYTRELQISMDGPDENTADILAGSPGYFRRSLDSIRNLVGRGFNFRVKAVVTPFNAPRVYEWIQMLVNLGVNRISVAAYNRTFYRHEDHLFLSQEDRELIGEQLKRAKGDFPEVEFIITGFDPILYQENQSPEKGAVAAQMANRLRTKAESWKDRTHCSGGRSSITITPDGKVVLCDTVPQEGIFVVGDVSTRSIMDVWNSEELLNFAYPPREKFAGSACYDCPDRMDCQSKAGYCFRDAFFNYGTVYGPPPKCPLAPDDGIRME
jgi:radical SAM protein with 4Fe4S-binding SPASM domain